MNYTKGKWYVNGDSIETDEHYIASVMDSVDAQLISTSPDMYETLKGLITNNDIAFLPKEIQVKIKSVVAKAEGEK